MALVVFQLIFIYFFFFEKILFGLASLYHIQMKSPKTVYFTEQCHLMSHRNSVHSVRRGTKMSKTSCPWYSLTVYSVMHLMLKHVLTAFYPSIDWMQYKCINLSFFVQNALLKGSYSYTNVDLDPLFVSVNVISLLFDRISLKLFQIMRK